MEAGEEVVVVRQVDVVFVDYCEGVRAVDLRVGDGLEVRCSVLCGPEAE